MWFNIEIWIPAMPLNASQMYYYPSDGLLRYRGDVVDWSNTCKEIWKIYIFFFFKVEDSSLTRQLCPYKKGDCIYIFTYENVVNVYISYSFIWLDARKSFYSPFQIYDYKIFCTSAFAITMMPLCKWKWNECYHTEYACLSTYN